MRWHHLICPTLVLLTLAVYWQTFGFDFVNLDDHTYVASFPRISKGLNYDNVVWAFTTTHFSNWHPLTWLSYMLDAQLFGIDAGRFHATNVAWHTANVLLLFVVLKQLTRATWRSAFVAAVFAVHPLHVESVAWISERKDVLATFFGLLAIGAYGRYCRKPARRWYLMSLAAFALSLMSKQTLVTLPFLLLLLDYWPLTRIQPRVVEPETTLDEPPHAITAAIEQPAATCPQRRWSRLVLEKAPFFCLTAAFCVIALLAQRGTGAMPSRAALPVATRLANAAVVYVLYIKKMVWPFDLAAFYPHPKDALPTGAVVGAVMLLVVATVSVVALARRRPYLPVGWFWYLGSLVPMLGLVQVGMHQMADRYSYIPLVGLYLLITWLACSGVRAGDWRRIVLPVIAVTVVAVLAVGARLQASRWRDSITLFQHTLQVTQANAFAHYSLGNALKSEGRHREAIGQYQQAIDIEPMAAYQAAWGEALRNIDLPEDAIPHFKRAIEIDPAFVPAYNRYGLALRDLGRTDDAIGQFRQAIVVDPSFVLAHYNWGVTLRDLGRFDQAIQHFQEAVSIDAEYFPAYNTCGILLHKLGRFDEAIHVFANALAVDPESPSAHYNLANVYRDRSRFEEAIRHYRKTVRLNPQHAGAHNNWGFVLYQQKRFEEAIEHFRAALEADPGNLPARQSLTSAHVSLGMRLTKQKKFDAAIGHFRRALKINDQFAAAHEALGKLYLEQRQPALAVEYLKAAVRLDPNNTQAKEYLRRATSQ